MEKKMNGFEKREALGDAYYKDPRWKKVNRLREENKDSEANGLVGRIRQDWGLE